MLKLNRILLLLLVSVTVFSVSVNADTKYPSPTKEFFVNDFANVLSQDTEQRIINIGKQLEEKTTAQVVLATVNSLEGQDIESYSIDLATKWEIGQKKKDNGVLILFAKKERLLRIEVGYGLEGALPDSMTAQIREQYIKPYTKNDDFDNGFLNGYIAIVKVVAGEYDTVIDTGGQQNSSTVGFGKVKISKHIKFLPILFIFFLIGDGVFFRFRITSTLIRIFFWSSFFRGGRGGWGGGGGGSWGGGSSGGGGGFGGGGSSGSV